MATATTISPLFPLSTPIHNNKNNFFSTFKSNLINYHNFPTSSSNKSSYQPHISLVTLSKHKTFHFQNPITKKPRNLIVSSATSSEDAAVIPTETTQQIVSATSGDETVSTVISTLLFIAFIALSILTIGVIYIAVTDFLLKREKDKFEKEEEAKKKKGGKKTKVRARTGPRGFGQKVEEEEDD
ncbi:uncharacterized protein LOC104900073 [Beta vulgaris subsp. vulgaris]|uniref:uncharacterized protein LOC104900073 n=1 Tax=Beta vulgaris subsp. vulgaris TaxID=3555 RepID=UPI002036C8F8|nr:uncharacterized protein LOC104900073 [Beta vulgaris subsp. vulgaris]